MIYNNKTVASEPILSLSPPPPLGPPPAMLNNDDEKNSEDNNVCNSNIYTILSRFNQNYYDPTRWELLMKHTMIKGISSSCYGYYCVYIGNKGYSKGIHNVAIQYVSGKGKDASCSVGVTSEYRKEIATSKKLPKDDAHSHCK